MRKMCNFKVTWKLQSDADAKTIASTILLTLNYIYKWRSTYSKSTFF